jgi:hypothetical protein
MPASDVGSIQDCSVFLDSPVSMPMSKIPTKRFTFKFSRPVEARPTRQDPLAVMMAQRNTGCLHLPPARTRIGMTGKDVLYNDFWKYLKDRGVGFPADLAFSVGDEFLKHITYAIFPLSLSNWTSINDKHNRGGAALDQEFKVFFGRRIIGRKAEKPSMTTTVQHLQELWFGMGKILTEENWPEVSAKIKKPLVIDPKLRPSYL